MSRFFRSLYVHSPLVYGGGTRKVVSELAYGNITFVNSSQGSIASGAGTGSLTLPASMAEGDLVVFATASDGFTGSVDSSGWDLLIESAGTTPGLAIYHKFMPSTPDTSIVVNQVGDAQAVIAMAFRNVSSSSPIDNSINEAFWEGVLGNPDCPAHTTVADNAMRILVGGLDDDNATLTAPSGFTTNAISQGVTGASIAMAYMESVTPGSVNPDAFTGSGDDAWYAVHFALRPNTL